MPSLTKPLSAVDNAARQDRRDVRYIARRFLHFNSSLHRVRFCGVDPVATMGHVTVKATGTGTDRRAGYGQLQVCGSVWACPVCSAKINNFRAADLAAAVSAWTAPVFGPDLPDSLTPLHRGGRIAFITFTMRHNAAQELADLWKRGISAAWSNVTSGAAWVAEQQKYGVRVPRLVKSGKHAGETRFSSRIGYARVVETTHGRNGWHVHIHALLFVHRDIKGGDTFRLADSMFGRWSAALVAAGFDAPSLEHGVDVKLVGPHDATKVSDYFSKNTYAGRDKAGKLAWEAAGGIGKWARHANRTPFQILQAICSGEDYAEFESDLDLWLTWESASKGKRQLTWSPWLRAYLGLTAEDTDEEIAASELGGDVVLRLRGDQFDQVVTVGAHKLLRAVEADDDMAAAYLWLDQHLGIWRTTTDYGLNESGEWVEKFVSERVV